MQFDQSIKQDDDNEIRKKDEKRGKSELDKKSYQSPSPSKKQAGAKISRKITKVKDLLRESQENAFNMNKADLDRMFNLQINVQDEDGNTKNAGNSEENASKAYIDKIMALRE